ncbi:hypothetical protein FRC16_004341, partial [Serendipita sp. 398]
MLSPRFRQLSLVVIFRVTGYWVDLPWDLLTMRAGIMALKGLVVGGPTQLLWPQWRHDAESLWYRGESQVSFLGTEEGVARDRWVYLSWQVDCPHIDQAISTAEGMILPSQSAQRDPGRP